jgi:hypothetical protein
MNSAAYLTFNYDRDALGPDSAPVLMILKKGFATRSFRAVICAAEEPAISGR